MTRKVAAMRVKKLVRILARKNKIRIKSIEVEPLYEEEDWAVVVDSTSGLGDVLSDNGFSFETEEDEYEDYSRKGIIVRILS